MLKLTVSGPPGSGTSTLVKGLCHKTGWTSANGGDIFRDHARKRGLTVEEFSSLCRENLDVDRALDVALKSLMTDHSGPEVVESRLSGWWAEGLSINIPRLHISTTLEERGKRLMQRDGGSYKDNLDRATRRHIDDSHRYMELYGIDLNDMTPYTHIIEADDMGESEVLETVLEILGVEF